MIVPLPLANTTVSHPLSHLFRHKYLVNPSQLAVIILGKIFFFRVETGRRREYSNCYEQQKSTHSSNSPRANLDCQNSLGRNHLKLPCRLQAASLFLENREINPEEIKSRVERWRSVPSFVTCILCRACSLHFVHAG